MSPRGLALLLVLLLIAAAAALWLARDATPPEAAAGEAPLLELVVDDVSRIELPGPPERIVLERRPVGWALSGDVTGEADPAAVANLLEAVRDARVARVVDERAGDLARFGLAPPARRVLLQVATRPDPIELRLGRASPVAWQRYVGREDGSVVLVDGTLGTALERSAASLLELRLFPLHGGLVRRVEIADPSARVALERRGRDWWVEAPFADRADTDIAERIARAAASIRFARVEPEPARGLGPSRRVSVWSDGDPAERVAELALAATDGLRLARRWPGPVAGRVHDHAAADFEGEPEALRERKIASFLLADVRELSWNFDGAGWVARRSSAADPWVLRRSAEGSGAAAPAEPIEALLDVLRRLSFSALRAPSPRTTRSAGLVVTGETELLVAIDFGAVAAGGVWAQSSWRPGIVGTLDAEAWHSLERAARACAP